MNRIVTRRSFRGFTLIELLVVIGIIAILIGISFSGSGAGIPARSRLLGGSSCSPRVLGTGGSPADSGSVAD